jgi:hypothetical protein
MNPSHPESETVMAFYRERQPQLTRIANELQVQALGPEVREELAALVGTENVPLLETIARIGC